MKNQLTFAFLLLSLLSIAQSNSYNKIGYHFDINQNPINEYADIDYTPINQLNLIYSIGSDFTPGRYYTKTNECYSGYLLHEYNKNTLLFKRNKYDTTICIQAKDCNGFMLGPDSFAVIRNFEYLSEIRTKTVTEQTFAEVIDQVDDLIFYRYMDYVALGHTATYLYRKEGTASYFSFIENGAGFKKQINRLIGDFKSLSDDIEFEIYGRQNLPLIVKLYKYYCKYKKQERIYFTSSWYETEPNKDYMYYAEIKSVQLSAFHLKFYYSDGTPYYEGQFKSLYPTAGDRTFTWYYPNGTKRKEVKYGGSKPWETTCYHTNGAKRYTCDITDETPYYYEVFDNLGNEILNRKGSGIEKIKDDRNNRLLTYEYVKHELNAVYSMASDGSKTYLFKAGNLPKLRISNFQELLNNNFKFPDEIITDNTSGYVLIKLDIESSGYIKSVKLLKGIHPKLDEKLLAFVSENRNKLIPRSNTFANNNPAMQLIMPIEINSDGIYQYRKVIRNLSVNAYLKSMHKVDPFFRMPPLRF